MKHLEKLSGLAVALLVLFTACEKDETKESNPTVQGIYEGSISGFQTKSTAIEAESIPATSEISITGENKIQVHCYSDNFDTTFMMNYYLDNDSAYVCYTGNDFEEMYGYMLGESHMMGGMMGGMMGDMMDDMQDGETQWMHHMGEEHEEGDEHFGGFDMNDHSFSYTFQMDRNDFSDDLHFHGVKQ
ncbi:MAG: hypothetical protein P1P82_17150 [Bacteroidales bacterium]|nr:hypothetical protein [Bacteroidales bacterium]